MIPQAMQIWIDAAPAGAELHVLGMTAVERHVRAARRAGFAAADIVVDGGPRSLDAVRTLVGEAIKDFPIRIACSEDRDISRRLRRSVPNSRIPVLALPGDAVVDPRLLRHLAAESGTVVATDSAALERALPSGFAAVYGDWANCGDGRCCAIRIAAGADLSAAETLQELGATLLTTPSTRHFDATGRDQHLAMQRRDVPFWIRQIPDAATRDRVERFLFDASYKGSTDILTRYILPYAVWPAVLLCTRFRVHPNSITLVSVVATFVAVPFFAGGWWLIGLALAWLMAVLDSVDGKVARLSMTDSKVGELLDHGLDIVHPPLWYFAWAIGLTGLPAMAAISDGRLFTAPVFQAASFLLVAYVADRLVLAIYKHRFGRGLHSHGRLDARVRGIISRRNINLAIFTLSLPLGLGNAAIYAITAWQIATLLWHACRTAWILGRGERPNAAA